MADQTYSSTTTAPVNIAVVKYWGKRDPTLNLPTNSSLSVTLSQADLRTLTTATTSPSITTDTLTLNDAPQEIATHARTQACLRELRAHRKALEEADASLPPFSAWKLRIVSENNFPTAAGLASSASGFAALVRCIADLYALPLTPTQLSIIARQGSGSACRSLFGGYVAWNAGSAADGSDSRAEEVAPVSHWDSMRALILVVDAAKKDVPSTSGMQATVATSGMFGTRAATVVPAAMQRMVAAVQQRDFDAFAETTMRESNSFHATCADTFPPIFYLTDVSRAAIRFVEALNAAARKQGVVGEKGYVAGYTFDAGPNAVVFYTAEHAEFVRGAFNAVLGSVSGWKGEVTPTPIEADARVTDMLKSGVSRVIETSVGEGPVRVKS